jgi:predicted short-subunit dehydrogenase-like oxidoreductase (DUF2520 family)
MRQQLRVFVYGAGRVGRSLARALAAAPPEAGVALVGAWNRNFARAFETSRLVDVEVSSGDAVPEAMLKAEVTLLCVPDDQIAAVAALLAPHLGHRQALLHCAGSLPAEIMRSPQTRCLLGGCHPLQALASPGGDPEALRGATFAIEGEGDALEAARRVALAVGGRPLELVGEHKALYHAAAVMSGNYLTALLDGACELLGECGVPAATGVEILLPLMEGTLHQLRQRHQEAVADPDPDADPGRVALAQALTGPIRRGDVGPVKAHVKALDQLAGRRASAAELAALYRLLGRRALHVARRLEHDPARAEALERALRDKGK